MGTPLDSIFVYTKKLNQLQVWAHGGIQIQICFSTIKDLPIWFFWNNGFFLSQNSYGYKTLWYSFWVIFGQQFTKFDLTLEIIIRNRPKTLYWISIIFLRIWKNNLLVAKSHMGTLLDWFFFTHKKQNSVGVWVIFGRTNHTLKRFPPGGFGGAEPLPMSTPFLPGRE